MHISTEPARFRILLAVSLLAGGAHLAGCDAKATKEECTKMVEHDYGILDQRTQMTSTDQGKKMFEELKAKTQKGCEESMTKSQVECHMKAPTPADMSKCDEGKK